MDVAQVKAGDALSDASTAPAAKVLWTGVAAECKLSRASLARPSNAHHADARYQVSVQVRTQLPHKIGTLSYSQQSSRLLPESSGPLELTGLLSGVADQDNDVGHSKI